MNGYDGLSSMPKYAPKKKIFTAPKRVSWVSLGVSGAAMLLVAYPTGNEWLEIAKYFVAWMIALLAISLDK